MKELIKMNEGVNDINDIHILIKSRTKQLEKDKNGFKSLKQSKSEFKIGFRNKGRINPNWHRGSLKLKHKTHFIDNDFKKWVTSSAKNIFSKHPTEAIGLKINQNNNNCLVNKDKILKRDIIPLEFDCRNDHNHLDAFQYQTSVSKKHNKHCHSPITIDNKMDYKRKIKLKLRSSDKGSEQRNFNGLVKCNSNKKPNTFILTKASIGVLSSRAGQISAYLDFDFSSAFHKIERNDQEKLYYFNNEKLLSKLSNETKYKIAFEMGSQQRQKKL